VGLTVVEGEAENISQTHIQEKKENMFNVLPILPSPENTPKRCK